MADYFVDGDSVLENKLDITNPDDFKVAEQDRAKRYKKLLNKDMI